MVYKKVFLLANDERPSWCYTNKTAVEPSLGAPSSAYEVCSETVFIYILLGFFAATFKNRFRYDGHLLTFLVARVRDIRQYPVITWQLSNARRTDHTNVIRVIPTSDQSTDDDNTYARTVRGSPAHECSANLAEYIAGELHNDHTTARLLFGKSFFTRISIY